MFSRTLEIEPGRRVSVAAAAMFALGFLPLPFGSLSTIVYFALAVVTLIEMARRRVRVGLPQAARFAAVICVAYFCLDALSVFIYENPSRSYGPLVGALHFLIWPVVLAGMASARFDAVRSYVVGVRAGTIVGGVIAILQVSDGIDRAMGGMVNPLPFGTTAVWFAFISLIGAFDHGWRDRMFGGAAFAAGLIAAFLSESRGAWLALPILLFAMLVYLRSRYGGRLVALAIAAIAALSVVAVIVGGPSIRERIDETITMFQDFELGNQQAASLDQRALMMVYGLEAVADRPLAGYGPLNAVPEVVARAARDGFEISMYRHLHNEYLTETVAKGLVGFAALLLLLATPIVTANRFARDDAFKDRMAVAAVATIGAALYGLTNVVFDHDITNTVFLGMLLAVGLSSAASGLRPAETVTASRPTPGAAGASPDRQRDRLPR
jgi:O-antigen ligase